MFASDESLPLSIFVPLDLSITNLAKPLAHLDNFAHPSPSCLIPYFLPHEAMACH
jgi:hypothetical protein